MQQACSPLYPSVSGSSSSSSAPSEQDIAWALSMVKSRTFGQQRQQQPTEHTAHYNTNSMPTAAATAAAAAVAGELDAGNDGDDESNVVLVLVPFVDMINHAPDSNCRFGLNWHSSR